MHIGPIIMSKGFLGGNALQHVCSPLKKEDFQRILLEYCKRLVHISLNCLRNF